MEDTIKYLNDANLDDMPVTVLQSIMASLSLDEVKHMCKLNAKINGICNHYGLLEIESRKVVQKEAPLSSPIATFTELADLIRKGFSTVYHVIRDGDEPLQASFGLAKVDDLGQTQGDNFEIIGTPPPPGTRVWIFGRAIDTRVMRRMDPPNIQVFAHPDEFRKQLVEDSKLYTEVMLNDENGEYDGPFPSEYLQEIFDQNREIDWQTVDLNILNEINLHYWLEVILP